MNTSFFPILPEILIASMGCIVLLVTAFMQDHPKRHGVVFVLTQLSLVVAFALSWHMFSQPSTTLFSGMFIVDKLAVILKCSILVSTFLVLVYSREYIDALKLPEGEYYVLCLFSVLGMMILTSAGDLLTLFMGMELFSLPIYALVAMRRDHTICAEAAMKYFVVGALASGILLYGFSLLYGATASIDLKTILIFISKAALKDHLVLTFGMIFALVGIGFKLGIAPFHMWVPDVYEGAPTSVTLFISAAPKIAAFAMAIRILVNAVPGLEIEWQQLLIILSLLSMVIGNAVAIVQTNIRRLLAYSSIAQMGYMLLGIISGVPHGYAASMFYAVTYAITSTVAFGLLLLLSRDGSRFDTIDDFKGLNARNPWLACMMMLVMFSLAGVPPFVGFMAKVGVLEALLHAHLVLLAGVSLLLAVVGAYYYLRIVKVMYFEEPQDVDRLVFTSSTAWVLSLNAITVVGLGLFPGALFYLCQLAF